MKILVLTQDYPSIDKPYAMSYVHSRNVEYEKLNHSVRVVNFLAKKNYQFDSIDVYPFSQDLVEWADIIVSHAPNVKNHIRALKSVEGKKIVFFFHGHEVLHQYGDYPAPYVWKKEKSSKKIFIKIYDHLKMIVIKSFLKKCSTKNKVACVFVSDWMKRQFVKNLSLNPTDLGQYKIIPNACNSAFLMNSYVFNVEGKLADSITIRPLDDSKYAVDLVVETALNNPNLEFHIYGKGNYFTFNEKPKNVTVINQFIQQKDIPELLNKYRFAMMPTRYDAQGVMMCEMATYGIPLVTTDFEVCTEMLKGFENVTIIPEQEFTNFKCDVKDALQIKNERFSPNHLIREELAFFNEL